VPLTHRLIRVAAALVGLAAVTALSLRSGLEVAVVKRAAGIPDGAEAWGSSSTARTRS
jgi:hypothetical protein